MCEGVDDCCSGTWVLQTFSMSTVSELSWMGSICPRSLVLHRFCHYVARYGHPRRGGTAALPRLAWTPETSLQCQAIFAALNNRCQRQNLEVPFGICGEVSQSFVRRFVRDPCAPQNGMVLEQREARLRSESVSAVVVVFGVALEVAPLPFPPTGALRFGHLGRRLSSPNPPYEQAPDLPRQVTAPDPSLEAICCRPAGRCWPPRSVIPSGWCSSRKTDWGPCRTV